MSGDIFFRNDLLEYQMKMADNLDIEYILPIRDSLEYKMLQKETRPSVYLICVGSTLMPKNWSEVIAQADNKQTMFFKVGTSNTKPFPTYFDNKGGGFGGYKECIVEKSALFGRLQSYYPQNKLLKSHIGMGDVPYAIIFCVGEYTEETRGQLAHKYEQDVLGMIKFKYGHPPGNIKEGCSQNFRPDSFSHQKRKQVQEEKKNGVGTLEQFFQ